MINFLTESATYKTTLKEDEIVARLKKIIFPNQMKVGLFGEINGQHFKLWEMSNRMGSRLYTIDGFTEKDYDGETTIKIKISPSIFNFSLGIIYSSLALGFILIQDFSNPSPGMGLASFVLICGIFDIFSFKYVCNRSRKDLQKIFEADIIEESPQ